MCRPLLIGTDGIEGYQSCSVGVANVLGQYELKREMPIPNAVATLVECARAVSVGERFFGSGGIVQPAGDGFLYVSDGDGHYAIEIGSTYNMTFYEHRLSDIDTERCGVADRVDDSLHCWKGKGECWVTQQCVLQFVGGPVGTDGVALSCRCHKEVLGQSCRFANGVSSSLVVRV